MDLRHLLKLRFKLWPTSLVGQLVTLLLLAIIVVQIITLILVMDERRGAIQSANREQILERTAYLVDLLEASPRNQWDRLLHAAASARLRFSVTPEAIIKARRKTARDDVAAREMNDLLGAPRDVHFQISDFADHPPIHPDDAFGEEPQPPLGMFVPPPHPPLPAGLVLSLSVPLKDGSWLNARNTFPPVAAFARTTIISSVIMALAVLSVAITMAQQIAKPLRALSQAADRFGRGADVGLLAETGPREVRNTIHAFNAMQQRLNRYLTDRMRMLGAISHDLRTPLTAMRLRAEFVEDDDIRDKLIEGIEEMSRMAQSALAFVRDDTAGEQVKAYNIRDLIQTVVDDFTDLGAKVELSSDETTSLLVRPTAFKSVIRNLVENAIRYGQDATIAVSSTVAMVTITIDDHGPGIPEDKLTEVFEPFMRLETSRNQETGGVGLGLAIARSAVHQHGGELVLSNLPEGGLRATITLPK